MAKFFYKNPDGTIAMQGNHFVMLTQEEFEECCCEEECECVEPENMLRFNLPEDVVLNSEVGDRTWTAGNYHLALSLGTYCNPEGMDGWFLHEKDSEDLNDWPFVVYSGIDEEGRKWFQIAQYSEGFGDPVIEVHYRSVDCRVLGTWEKVGDTKGPATITMTGASPPPPQSAPSTFVDEDGNIIVDEVGDEILFED